MRAGQTLTYLELTGIDELHAGRVVPDLAVAETRDVSSIRDTTLAIGAPYAWPTQLWDDRAWQDYVADCSVRHWLALHSDPAGLSRDADSSGPGLGSVPTLHSRSASRFGVVGLASLRFSGDEIELETFGLLPDQVGRGLGGAFLVAVVRTAWTADPAARRIWLHTSDQDGPYALANYLARGFRVFGGPSLHERDPG